MPPRVRGGHQQGLRATIVVAVEPEMRRKIEEESDARRASGWSDHTLSGVVRDALEEFFAEGEEG